MKKQNLKRHVLFSLLFAGAVAMGLFSCANDVGSSDYIADNSGDHYYGINGGAASTGTMTPATGGGTSGGTAVNPAPTPTPTPTPGPGIAMKTGSAINAALKALGANSGSGKSFVASASAPPAGAATQLLSDVTASTPTQVLAWADGSTIKYYAQGYTDSNRKILLNADSSEMFRDCTGLTSLNVSGFDTSNVTNMSYMFHGCSHLTSLNVSSFNTSKVTDMTRMFSHCEALTSLNVSSFNTSKVTTMECMFAGCQALTSLNVGNFNTSKVTNMQFMFSSCYALTSLNVSSFDTSKVTDMLGTFAHCHKLQVIDVSSWNTSLVTNMAGMFQDCAELLTIYASNNFVTTSVTDSSLMWAYSPKLVGGQGTVNTGGGNKIYARIDGGTSAPGYFTAKP